MGCARPPGGFGGTCPAITRLNRQRAGRYDYPQEKTFAKLQACLANPAHAVFVAERGGEVVGYLHLEEYDVLYAGHMVNVLGIAVSSACRRQGVGRALLAAGEAWARSQGAEAMRLGLRRIQARAPTPFTQAWGIRATSSSGTSKRTSPKRGRDGLSFFAWKQQGSQGILMKRMLKIKNFKKAIDILLTMVHYNSLSTRE